MSQQDASATRPYRGLMVLNMREKIKKMKNLCILQVSAVTLSGGVGEGVTVCFLLRQRK